MMPIYGLLLAFILGVSSTAWAQFNFALEHNTAGITVHRGSSAILAVHATLLSGSPQDVTLSASGLPAGTTVSFQGNPLRFDRAQGPLGFDSTYSVYIQTSPSTPLETRTVTITATGGALSRSASFPLTVVAVTGSQIRYVATPANGGNDSAAGTTGAPWATLQKAANTVAAGWTVVVRAGEYRERVNLITSGTSGSPITWIAEGAVTITGSQSVTGWSSAGGGIYEKSISSMPFGGAGPGGIVWNGRHIPWIMVTPDGHEDPSSLIARPSDNIRWTWYGAIGYTSGGTARLRFNTDNDPDNEPFELSAENDPTVDFNDKDWNIFSGFTIKNGQFQTRFSDGATGNIVQHCRLIGGQYSVLMEVANQTIIRNNEMTLNYFYEDHGHPLNVTEAEANIYGMLRLRMSGEGKHASVMIHGADNTQIYENHMFRHFAGVNLLGDDEPDQMRIFRNYIHHVDGYSLELKIFGDFTYIHDNLLYENTENTRIDSIPDSSTIYYYRNRLDLLTRSASTDPCASPPNYCGPEPSQSDMTLPETQASFYIYHNSFNGHGGLHFHSESTNNSPNIWVVNNILSSKNTIVYFGANSTASLGNNWVGGSNADELLTFFAGTSDNVVAQGQRMWGTGPNPSFLPLAGAVGLGLNLSAPWGFGGPTNPAMPGMSPGYFAGSAPDAGTFQVAPDIPPQPVGPVVLYKCNGNFLDEVNGFTATGSGGTLTNGAPIVDGNSCRFDGVDDLLTAPNDAAFRQPSVGLAVWTSNSAPASGDECRLMHIGTAIELGRTDSGRLFCRLNNGSVSLTSSTAISDAVVHLPGCGFDANSGLVSLWLDNVVLASETLAGFSLSYGGSDTLQVGGSGAAGDYCAFNADNIRMNGEAWTALGMQQVFDERVPAMGTTHTSWRFYQNNAAEGTTIAGQGVDAPRIVQARSGTLLMGVNIKRSGSTINLHYGLECNLNGGAFVPLDNSCAINPACITTDSVKDMGDQTSDLGDISGGGFTFVPGRYEVDTINAGLTTQLLDGQFTIWRYGLGFRPTLADGNEITCRPRTPSGVFDDYPPVLGVIEMDVPSLAGGAAQMIGGQSRGGIRR